MSELYSPQFINNETLFIPIHDYSSAKFKQSVLDNLQTYFKLFYNLSVTDVQFDRVSGAMTNIIFIVSSKFDKYLVRFYGHGTDILIDRKKEISWLSKLTKFSSGPVLVGVFKNGRIEQFINGKPLNKTEIRSAENMVEIAKSLGRLHNITAVYKFKQDKHAIDLWENVSKWFVLAKDIYSKKVKKFSKDCVEIEFDLLEHKTKQYKKGILELNSYVSFCHNDMQYGNILKNNKQTILIDYEYSGYNYLAFDIANHFCEWGADYHGPSPHLLNKQRYPTEEQMKIFIYAYFCESDILANNNIEPDTLLAHVRKFMGASDLMWGLWGVIQGDQSNIEFDYLAYGTQRLKSFMEIQ